MKTTATQIKQSLDAAIFKPSTTEAEIETLAAPAGGGLPLPVRELAAHGHGSPGGEGLEGRDHRLRGVFRRGR